MDPTPVPSSPATRRQPSNTQAGLSAAAEVLRDGTTRWWRPWTARRERERGLVRTVLGAVADVPAASLQPLIGASGTFCLLTYALLNLKSRPYDCTHIDCTLIYTLLLLSIIIFFFSSLFLYPNPNLNPDHNPNPTPTLIPVALCEGVSLGLQGLRNELSPDVRRDLDEKYRA